MIEDVWLRQMPRWGRWSSAAAALDKMEHGMYITALGLGTVDCELRDSEPFQAISQETERPEMIFYTMGMYFKSSMWLLGAYELVRSVDEYLGGKNKRVTSTKRTLGSFRMPAAKYQKQGTSKNPERLIARPGLSVDGYVGWVVGDSDFVTRHDLGDAVLETLEDFASSRQVGEIDLRRRVSANLPKGSG